MYLYISIYIYIYLYIYIYIEKKRNILRSFAKERNILAFFYVLCKRTLRSFTFFAIERCFLCILSGLISHLKLEKRTEKNGTFFKRTERSERKRTWCPTLLLICLQYISNYWAYFFLFFHHMYVNKYSIFFFLICPKIVEKPSLFSILICPQYVIKSCTNCFLMCLNISVITAYFLSSWPHNVSKYFFFVIQ